ncbi:MAG TPA: DUF11 domain-containing protein [Tenericutes bacterium]|nr:DUF11 domain-containing protein [Mycoplasmatota bacterium]
MDQIENISSIDYSYKIDPNGSAYSDTIESNQTITPLAIGELELVKSVDKAYATIGDELTYTIEINNIGNILLSDVELTDSIPNGASFVTGSVTIDGVPDANANPANGINLGSLIILQSKVITFKVEVISLPSTNTISNSATATFNYLVILPVGGSSTSNTVTTTINVNNLSVVKSASPATVTIGDTITYTTVITNNGNINAEQIEFIDELDSKITFLPGSVTVDGTPQPTYNPNDGFSLGTLAPENNITVVFEAKVN